MRLAVASARSWRAVMRHLGLNANSSQAQLSAAVASSRTWVEVAAALGLRGGSSNTALKGHAARLGLDTSHMGRPRAMPSGLMPMQGDIQNLSRSGEMIAAAWFSMCGYHVSWPLDPCRHDLLVEGSGEFKRVQVKTTGLRRGRSWVVSLTSSSAAGPLYDPDEIDYFFVIDGTLEYYLIPVSSVGGLHSLNLSAYQQFRVVRDVRQPT